MELRQINAYFDGSYCAKDKVGTFACLIQAKDQSLMLKGHYLNAVSSYQMENLGLIALQQFFEQWQDPQRFSALYYFAEPYTDQVASIDLSLITSYFKQPYDQSGISSLIRAVSDCKELVENEQARVALARTNADRRTRPGAQALPAGAPCPVDNSSIHVQSAPCQAVYGSTRQLYKHLNDCSIERTAECSALRHNYPDFTLSWHRRNSVTQLQLCDRIANTHLYFTKNLLQSPLTRVKKYAVSIY